MTLRSITAVVLAFSQVALYGQQPPTLPPGFVRAPEGNQQRQAPAPAEGRRHSAAQAPAQPGAPTAKPQAAQPQTAQPQAPVAVPTLAPSQAGGLNLQNASLTEVIDILARQLKINYILDPRVKGA